MMGTIQGQDRAFRGLKKFSGGGGTESENSVCPSLLLQFFFSFCIICQSDYARFHHVTSVYIGRMGSGARQPARGRAFRDLQNIVVVVVVVQ